MARAIGLGAVFVGAVSAALDVLPPKTLGFSISRVVNQTAYATEMQFGTPPQKLKIIIDSGSPFLGIPGTHSNWCELAKKPCAQYGSYDNTTSSTAKYIDDQFFNALINDGFGDDIQDTVTIGGQTFPKTEFGMILDYRAHFPAEDTIPGLIGLVPFCYDKNLSCTVPAATFEQKLLAEGYITRHTVAFYLGPDEASATGEVLFGAVDHAKQLGTPVTFPVIPLSNQIANLSPNVANFSSVSLEQSSASSGVTQSTTHFNISKGSYGILDSGNPNWSVPTPVWKFLSSHFGIKSVNTQSNYSPVDCKFRQPQSNNATLVVGFAQDKLKIRVPLERLVTELSPGNCATAVIPCGADGKGCAFGDPFLRSTYLMFDFDNKTVTMSNVKYTNQTNIVAV